MHNESFTTDLCSLAIALAAVPAGPIPSTIKLPAEGASTIEHETLFLSKGPRVAGT
jgi:hypothetical protein